MDDLGDLQDSPTSQRLVELAGARLPQDGYWASESWELGALLASNGIPALTGDQWTGPSDAWLALDPTRQYESIWNRGASVIHFLWDPALPEPEITNREPDQIYVRVSPCDPGLQELNLRFAISRSPMQAECLTSEGTVAYSGAELSVYRVG